MDFNKLIFQNRIKVFQTTGDGSDAVEQPSDYGILYRISLNFGYYLGIIPFKLGEDGTIYRNKAQRVFCGTAYIITLFIYFTEVRQIMMTDPGSVHYAIWYFRFFIRLASLTVKLTWFLLLWRVSSQEKFSGVVRTLRNLKLWDLDPHIKQKILRRVAILICAFYYLVGFLTWVFGYHVSPTPIYQNPTEFYMHCVSEANFAFFFSSSPTKLKKVEDMDGADHFLMALFMLFQYFRCVIGVYFDTLYIATILSLYLPTLDFVGTVKSQMNLAKLTKLTSEEEVNSTLSCYKKLYDFAEQLNGVTRWGILTFLLEKVILYSVNLNAIFVAPDWFQRVRTLVFIVGVVKVLITSAEICRRLEIMKKWVRCLSANKTVADAKLSLLYTEFGDNPIAVSGGVFKITYSLLGKVLITLITFFIICLS